VSAPARKNIRAVIKALKSKGYKIYEKPYQLNIVGIRDDSVKPNKFDDRMYVFWKDDKGKWEGKYYTVTTDTGTYWLKNPMHPMGAALLKEGQYANSYVLGNHKGYRAIVQNKPVTVIRDYDRDDELDFKSGREMTGNFGINIHRAGSSGDTVDVDKWSAGCQVFSNANDFQEFLNLAEKHNKLYGNSFTYTLIDERAYNRKLRRRGVYIVMGVVLVGATWSLYRALSNKPIIPKFK
jgi:hypothetical protein